MRNYIRLLHYARGQRAALVWVFALSLATAGFVALRPWPMKLLVDHVLGSEKLGGGLQQFFKTLSLEPTHLTILAFAVLGGLALFALGAAVDAAMAWNLTVAGRRMVYSLAEDLFARLQRRSLLFHTRNSVGDVVSRVTGDSWCVYQVVDALVIAPAHALLTIGAMIFLMAELDLTLTLVALAVAPFMVAASFLVGKPLRAAAKLKREIESRIQSHIQQTLTGIPVVQAFAQEDRENLRFQRFADAAIRSQQRAALIGSVNSLSTGLVTTLGSGVVLWIGARHVLTGSLTIGGILVFLAYLNSLQAEMKVFANLYTTLMGLSANANRVVEVLDAEPDVVEKTYAPPLPSVQGHVQLDGVFAGYDRDRPVLQGVSLDIKPGQTVAIVGATGAGKTTLVNLIPRYLDPWEGRVLVDGHDVRDVRLQSLRGQVSIVLQESFLFPFSITENIAYGRADATREEVEAAARAASAHDFIIQLPEGYETVIGERGATLSGGERQRLAIARAFLKNAPILILDEPTSALDAQTEQLILEALERLMRGRTTFVIAHRLSTVRRANRIVVLRGGQIVESGTHDELLVRAGHYAHLHQIQTHGGTAVRGAIK